MGWREEVPAAVIPGRSHQRPNYGAQLRT